MKKDFRFREIPYNYTSFSDREIILRYFDSEMLDILESLRAKRVTGRSAKLLFEMIGDIFIIDRNPYIFNDLLENRKKLRRLENLHAARLSIIARGSGGNPLVERMVEKTRVLQGEFFGRFAAESRFRARALRALGRETARSNVHFTAIHKVAHATDATDWRVEYPAAIAYPDSAGEVPGIVLAAWRLGLSLIPRGGGTGLTGGAVPVMRNTLVLNMEKLDRVLGIQTVTSGGAEVPVVRVEAGAVTDDVIEYCARHDYIFATDPTSAWASTIGGNIAENAGGKKCVMWGTAIDNLYSFLIVDAAGRTLEVTRRDHPHRKIEPGDLVVFDVRDAGSGSGEVLKTITLSGTDVRRKGLGKDITNKALGGLPGVQKEGGDGIIVSACFVLYRPFAFRKTICLEFFGSDLVNAARAIVDITAAFRDGGTAFLTALEHFDEKYVLAINYRNKSARTEIPKAVLLVDVEGNDRDALDKAGTHVLDLVRPYNTEGFIAESDAEGALFWKDRKNLGAIARHTNAFKLNEDVVIPLERLPEFADYIERLNIEKEIANDLRLTERIVEFLLTCKRSGKSGAPEAKLDAFAHRVTEIRDRCRGCLAGLEGGLPDKDRDGQILVSVEEDVLGAFPKSFHGYAELIREFETLAAAERTRRIIIATHMHAGDGNVHVNIPVHSNDYLMMREADETAGAVMREAVRLGGVVSGEHGIGLTKLKYIGREVLDAYAAYKRDADPGNLFNPGKLDPDFPLHMVYTPSFNLLELEAFILKAADIESLSASIAACVRCGKCKSTCNTHYPRGTMFYNPRNKILGVALITEAVLYDAQTSKSLSFRHFKKLREISDHCTMCHKCSVPCPVKIDFGNITLDIRDLMFQRRKAKFKLVTWLTLYYLRRRGYYANKFFRLALLKAGYAAQRTAHYAVKPVRALAGALAPRTTAMLKGRLPRSGDRTLRELLGIKGSGTFCVFENPDVPVKGSVVYFPGCGSERMFPEISIATIALLYHAGVRIVILPEYLCCGYPLLANGRTAAADMKSYENRVMMHRIADMLGYMEIRHVLVSCGTCFEMLEKYEIENIFNGAALMDINEYLASEGLYSSVRNGLKILYHEPCHTPLKNLGASKTFESLFGASPVMVPRCCGEGGTLALSTPEISNLLRERKAAGIVRESPGRRCTVLTTCPSCVQGLSRIDEGTRVTARALVVYAAETFLGIGWKKQFMRSVKKKGVEKILY